MKKIKLLFIVACGLFIFSSCSKNDDSDNYFSFDGTKYQINKADLTEFVFGKGTTTEQSVFQFRFRSIAEEDTTSLYISVLDAKTNTLDGNYPAFDQNSTTATRGIGPFGFYFASAIIYQNGDGYFTGKGGSVDIEFSDNSYSIDFNSISAGEYADFFDENEDGNSEYSEVSTIDGCYKGSITKTTKIITSPTKSAFLTNMVKNKAY